MKLWLGRLMLSLAFGPFCLCGGMVLLAHLLMEQKKEENK